MTMVAQSGDSELTHYEKEVYQSFMVGYVQRINEATFQVPIGGIRIGSARHSRLAQINLRTRVITFSRFAIENVPERGRRYLVLHELAHVKEAGHNKRFWSLVGQFEPDYKRIGRELERAFHRNVRESQRRGVRAQSSGRLPALPLIRTLECRDEAAASSVHGDLIVAKRADPGLYYPQDAGVVAMSWYDDPDFWDGATPGIICGGSESTEELDDGYLGAC